MMAMITMAMILSQKSIKDTKRKPENKEISRNFKL